MTIDIILAELDAEILRLQEVKTLLTGAPVKHSPGRASKSVPIVKKRTMSAEGRARIAAAQKARWAKAKKSAK